MTDDISPFRCTNWLGGAYQLCGEAQATAVPYDCVNGIAIADWRAWIG